MIHAKNDGSVFIVMEFVDGGTLYDAAKRQPNLYYGDARRAAAVARDVAGPSGHVGGGVPVARTETRLESGGPRRS